MHASVQAIDTLFQGWVGAARGVIRLTGQGAVLEAKLYEYKSLVRLSYMVIRLILNALEDTCQ